MRTTVAAVGLALIAAAPAGARPRPPAQARPAQPWATVNVCDSVGHPDSIGIRGSMPGPAEHGVEMFMRFQVQFLRHADGLWHNLGAAADSGFVDLGPAHPGARQSGQTFTITPPRPGQPAHELRGVVTFEWRRGAVVLRHVRRRTTAGHPDTAGADPVGFSAATCLVT
jgi:hypothetical protein